MAALTGKAKNALTIALADPGSATEVIDNVSLTADVTAGTVTASKVLVAGADKNLDTLAIADGGLKLGSGAGTAVNATAAELNAHADASTRIVNVTASATALALTAALHANRIVLVPVITGAGLTITLPAATGTGDKYTILNNGVQTTSLTVTALAGDLFYGSAIGFSETVADSGDRFLANESSHIKYVFNITTTGGIGKDRMELIDIATDKWLVHVIFEGSGTLATGFA